RHRLYDHDRPRSRPLPGITLHPGGGRVRRRRRAGADARDRHAAGHRQDRRARQAGIASRGDAFGGSRLRIRLLAGYAGQRQARRCTMKRVAIVGAGMTSFGEHFSLGIKDLVPMALSEAIASVDKGFERRDIGAAWMGEVGATDGHAAGILADSCGLLDIPVTRIENACATGQDIIRQAIYAIASGYVDVAIALGADKVRDTSSSATFWDWMALTRDMAWDFPLGLVAPANFALH